MGTSLIVSFADQILLSGMSFSLNLLLIRLWTPHLFGLFSMIVAIQLVGLSVQNALVGSQLGVLRPRAQAEHDEPRLLSSLWTANCLLIAVIIAVTLIGLAIIEEADVMFLPLAASAYIGCTLLREYMRSFLFSGMRGWSVLATDMGYGLAAATGLIAYWHWHGELEPAATFLIIGLASALVSLPSLILNRRFLIFALDRATRSRMAAIWRDQSQWALLGAITYETTTRAHIFVVSIFFGTSALGVLQAGAAIFRPLGLLLQAWRLVALPMFSRFEAADERQKALRLERLTLFGALAVSVAFAGAVWAFWPVLETNLFRWQYAGIGLVAVLWCITTAIRLVSELYSTRLQSLGRFRDLSFTSLAGSIAAMFVLAGVVEFATFQWAIAAIAVGYLVDLALMRMILSHSLTGSCATAEVG